MDAVRKEIQKLLDAGLIEPGISNWASPMLITVKKDSKPGDLRIKIICDFRRLNAITIPDTGGLGNQDEILMGFGDGQHYTGIVDAAGGFYSFCIRPSDRIKTNFVLPVSMGGTSFVWSVAPYGLTRNPAGYSRAVMFTLHGLSEVELAPLGQSHGGVRSWLDDITMRADSIAGFVDLFERVLRRLVAGGISLKGEKCHLLRENLEILGFLQTLTGLKMQPDKTDALRRMRPPTTKSEVQTYLGAVNFYRRFVPRIALLAAPMSAMLKKGGTYDQGAVEQAFGAINMFLTSDALLSPPDLRDQLAEYVICTDASNVAAGGVLMQWQHPNKSGERGPPDGIPFRGEAGKDPITHSWRLDAGWLLRTIAYYSKTFDSAQRNYCTFDKESSAIFLCCRHWSNLITGCWTTIYTDSSVAASMLTKHQGPPRLQRWGMELGTYLPYLKIAFRKGSLNGVADLLSRFPLFERYVSSETDCTDLPEDLFEKLGEAEFGGRNMPLDRYELYDSKNPVVCTEIWQAQEALLRPREIDLNILTGSSRVLTVGAPDEFVSPPHAKYIGALPSPTDVTKPADLELFNARMPVLAEALMQHPFHVEQRAFENQLAQWELYVAIFRATYARSPVVYDLYCGPGGFSRGAREGGCLCYGFDSEESYRGHYETDPAVGEHMHAMRVESGMCEC